MIIPDVGGAFGTKGVIAPEVAAVAAAAIALGVPVKWTEDRLENLVGAYQGRGIEGDLELALDGEGRMLALRARLRADLGGYLLTTTPIPPHTAATLIAGCYDINVADVEVLGMRTNKVPTGPYRGAGRPDAAYMIEALVDEAARIVGIDRVTLRRRNLIRRFPHRTPTGLEYDSGDFERCLDLALALADRPPADRAGGASDCARDRGRVVRRARRRCVGDGRGHARAGWAIPDRRQLEPPRSGPRHHVRPDRRRPAGGSAGRRRAALRRQRDSPPGVGTFGSRSVALAGSAVALAADRLVAAARVLAAELLEGRARGGPPRRRRLRCSRPDADVGGACDRARPREPLRAAARFESANVFSSGAYAASVAIDRATGTLSVARLVAVDDAGTLINPLLAHGQVVGGAVQGLGECLVEEAVYDEAAQLQTGSFLDYSLLTAAEIPPIVTGEVQTPSPLNPLGAKGAGEGGAVGTLPAVANAVADALGGRVFDPPFTAEKLWRALR